MSTILFVLNGTTRHEVISLPPNTTLPEIIAQISNTITSSPNCAEFMAKYKKAEAGGGEIGEIKVRWSLAARDSKIWPQSTVVTEENYKAVMQLMDTGKDVMEITLA